MVENTVRSSTKTEILFLIKNGLIVDKNYETKGSITCNQIDDIGFSSHVPCQIKPSPGLSFCKLCLKDKAEIIRVALNDIIDALPTGCSVFANCWFHSNFTRICHLFDSAKGAFDYVTNLRRNFPKYEPKPPKPGENKANKTLDKLLIKKPKQEE